MKLRKITCVLFAAIVATSTINTAVGADTAAEKDLVEYLFVQYAKSVTLRDGKLTLRGIQPETLYFSDRPHRIVGRESTRKFIEHWDEGKDSFEKDPPNAVLAVMSKPVPLDLVVVLKNPVLDGDNLIYQVEVLDGPESGEGMANALFIDVIGAPLVGPTSVRGVSRRTARRTARRVDRRDDVRDEVREDIVD